MKLPNSADVAPARSRNAYSVMEAAEGADGRWRQRRPWSTSQVPTDQAASATIYQDLSVATYAQGCQIDWHEPYRFSELFSARWSWDITV